MEFKTQIPLWFKYHSGIYYSFHRTTNIQKKRFPFGNLSVGLPGLEPGKAGPESAVLPLHHSPRLNCDAKVLLFFVKQIVLAFFLLKNKKNFLFSEFMAKKPLYLF